MDLICDVVGVLFVDGQLVEIERAMAAPQVGQAAIARDRVQPWLERDGLAPAADGAICGDERHLERVLAGLATPEHVHAEREDTPGVPVIDRLEGGIVTRLDTRYQPIVGFVFDTLAGFPMAEPRHDRRCPHRHSVRLLGARVQSRAKSAL